VLEQRNFKSKIIDKLENPSEDEQKLAKINKHLSSEKMVKELMNAYYLLKDDEDTAISVTRSALDSSKIGVLCNFEQDGLIYIEL